MQCASCGFENIPGIKQCARCHSVLNLNDIAIVPPRARRFGWGTRWRRLWNRISSIFSISQISWPQWKPASLSYIPWEAVTWSIVPGMGHIKYASKRIGWLIFLIWLCLMITAFLAIGLPASWWCLSVAVAVHAAAILSFTRPLVEHNGLFVRMLFSILLFTCLRLFIYYPFEWIGGHFYVPLQVYGLRDGNIIQNNDSIIYEGPWLRPDTFIRGDLVAYRIADMQIHHAYVREGLGLDRVVGIPGDHIQLKNDILLVNGKPAKNDEIPLGNAPLQINYSITLKNGEYAIIPSLLPLQIKGNVQTNDILTRISRVQDENILGRIRFRLHPWSRFGRIK